MKMYKHKIMREVCRMFDDLTMLGASDIELDGDVWFCSEHCGRVRVTGFDSFFGFGNLALPDF